MTKDGETSNSRWQRFRERLSHTYRLVIMNNDTFEEVSSHRLTLFNFYILISTMVVITAVCVVLLIAFTPIKRYIPGYGKELSNTEVRKLTQQIYELESELEAHRAYSDNFRKILVGDVNEPEIEEDISPENLNQPASTLPPPEVPEVDRELRQEVLQTAIRNRNQEERPTNLAPKDVPLEQEFFVPPIKGEISAPYSPQKDHFGVDIIAPKNTPVKATMEGYIFQSDWTLETGNVIGIQHSNNIISFYKHNSANLKKVGSYVKAGEAVAIIGNTGEQSSGPHLHFELWHKGKPVNPRDYVTF